MSFTRTVAVALLAIAAGCATPDRPDRPPGATPPDDVSRTAARTGSRSGPVDDIDLRLEMRSDLRELGPYLEMYPLGKRGRRKDLLAHDDQRSMHLVQLELPLRAHHHPARTEYAYVLEGRGTVYVGDRSYPAAPGAAFRIEPGLVHSVVPSGDEPLIAITYYEPPLVDGDDSVYANDAPAR